MNDPLDFYGGRLTKAERKTTLTEQLLADTDLTHTRKKRYSKLQVRHSRKQATQLGDELLVMCSIWLLLLGRLMFGCQRSLQAFHQDQWLSEMVAVMAGSSSRQCGCTRAGGGTEIHQGEEAQDGSAS